MVSALRAVDICINGRQKGGRPDRLASALGLTTGMEKWVVVHDERTIDYGLVTMSNIGRVLFCEACTRRANMTGLG